MADLYLELYREKIPPGFASLPGADRFDPEKESLYWAVLIGAPAANSAEAEFIAPVGPDSEVGATTHGTDTLSSGTTSFVPSEVCVWQPKEPPYAFHVHSPTNSLIDLDPPDGGDEHIWHCAAAQQVNGIGIWVVDVELRVASELPRAIGNRHACLNPDDVDFDAAHFEHQPLLRIRGDDERTGPCADLTDLTASGCWPGQVVFDASIEGIENVQEIDWNFGDGTQIVGDATETHTYGANLPDSLTASVTIVRQPGCSPLTQTLTVTVPPCEETEPTPPPVRCPELEDVRILARGACAPGTVQFRATVANAAQVESIIWNFDDEDGDVEGGLTIEHTFDERRTYDVTVSILRPEGCSPRVQTLEIEVPPCLVCPELTGIAVTGCIHADGPSTVTLQAQGSDLGQVADFNWSFGDGTATTNGPEVTHTYQDDQERDVTVSIRRPRGCNPREQEVSTRVRRCPEEIDWCLIWWWIMLGCIVGAIICAVVAACLYAPPPAPQVVLFWIFLTIAVALGLIGAVIFVVWLIFCARSNCTLLLWLIDILAFLAAIAFILSVILGAMGSLCAAGAVADLGYLGTLLAVAYYTAKCIGCLRTQDGEIQCFP